MKEEIKIGLNIYCMLGINLLNLVILATPYSPLRIVICSEMCSRKKNLGPDFLILNDHCEKNIMRIFPSAQRACRTPLFMTPPGRDHTVIIDIIYVTLFEKERMRMLLVQKFTQASRRLFRR